MIEAEVHHQLRAFLREQGQSHWPHHLTLARLVARALRLGRSALIQAGSSSVYSGRYRLSYLISIIMWPGAAVVVAPKGLQQQLLSDFTYLRDWVPSYKPIQCGDTWPHPNFQGLLLTTPKAWLADRLGSCTAFPANIPTLIDGVDDLETWVREQLTATLTQSDWEALTLAFPDLQQIIRDSRIQLAHSFFSRPQNPYHRYLLDANEQSVLSNLWQSLIQNCPEPGGVDAIMPLNWQRFWRQFNPPDHLLWVSLNREEGQFRIHCGPVEVASVLNPLWQQQPVVLIGAVLDRDADASIYRQRLGLGEDLTCLKFGLDRHNELIHLYTPEHLPLPNTPNFQSVLQRELHHLLVLQEPQEGPIVILVGDQPLKAQLAATLAGEFGSRVRMEQSPCRDNSILVCDWQFWREHSDKIPTPSLLIAATLPIPSLEDPLVSGRVAHYKRHRQDWFRLYLLPTALNELQRAIAPVRSRQGMVALLDTRLHYRSYGRQIIESLSPAARLRSLEQAQLFVSNLAP